MSDTHSDRVFAGSIPQIYETYLVPLIFQPYADDLLQRLRARPLTRILELAAGTGVVTRALAAGLPDTVSIVASDLQQPMLDQAARTGTKRPVEWRQADAMALPFENGSFDAVICFRLFHHFPNPEIRQRVVSELCRVAWRYVALSYFSPYSVTSLQRRWREAQGGRKSQKFATPFEEVEGYFRKAGFRPVRDFARLPLIHTLHLGVFQRAAC